MGRRNLIFETKQENNKSDMRSSFLFFLKFHTLKFLESNPGRRGNPFGFVRHNHYLVGLFLIFLIRKKIGELYSHQSTFNCRILMESNALVLIRSHLILNLFNLLTKMDCFVRWVKGLIPWQLEHLVGIETYSWKYDRRQRDQRSRETA